MNRTFKVAGARLEESDLRRNDYHAYLDRVYAVKLRYKELYESLCSDASLDGPYVYVPLHYQPERTTCPDGGVFNDQTLMVRLLSAVLPAGWRLYAKEHRTQFSYSGNGEQARDEDYYRDMAVIPKVRFIRLEVDSRELIDSARAVATVTGMAGWEAICRGKPALIFGNAWYRLCRGVFKIKTLQDCRSAMAAVENGVHLAEQDVNAFVAAIERISVAGYVSSSNAPAVEVQYQEHVEGLTRLLQRFGERAARTAID
jgi:hypothetical protein